MEKFIFDLSKFAIGDSLVFTTLIRDIHLEYPKMFKTYVRTWYPDIFFNNPYQYDGESFDSFKSVLITHNDVVFKRNEFHYSEIFNKIINEKLNVAIQQNSIFPELYLTSLEKSTSILNKLEIEKPFWLINASFKHDMPLKLWPFFNWIQLIKKMKGIGINIVQSGSIYDISENLPNIKSVIGETENLRDFISLCYHSSGIITHTSLHVHIAAALDKPCIVINGGRENPTYSCYPNQQVFHTVGTFDCCFKGGCYKKTRDECTNLIGKPAFPVCMVSIRVDDVMGAVNRYNNKVIGD